jgi:hypothetical protein
VLTDDASVVALVHANVLVASCSILLSPGPLNRSAQMLSAIPRAAIVTIAVYQRELDSTCQKVLEVFDTSAAEKVGSRLQENVLDYDGNGREVYRRAQLFLYPVSVKEASCEVRWEGIGFEMAEVEIISLVRAEVSRKFK